MILGASFDSPEENRAFKDKFNFPYDLLCDTGKSMGVAYGAAGDAGASHPARISYLIDPEGKIAKVYGKVVPRRSPLTRCSATSADARPPHPEPAGAPGGSGWRWQGPAEARAWSSS